MAEGHKLQTVSYAPDDSTINYGSKEDDDRALETLPELLTSTQRTKELFASEIIRSLEILSEVMLLLLVYTLDCEKVKYMCISRHYEPLFFCAE